MNSSNRYSYFHRLTCSQCGQEFDTHQLQTYCRDCQAPLLSFYDIEGARQVLDREAMRARPKGMWRWHELLPVFDPGAVVTLGEGDTPLLPVRRAGDRLGLANLYLKDEGMNPTGSFKARGLAAAVSKAYELHTSKVIIPTAGNAGGAMAAYASRAGMKAFIAMPKDSPHANIYESQICGAEVVLIDGLISDAAKLVGQKAQAEDWLDLSTFKEPYRVEGKKIMGYELAEGFDYQLPDVILYPTGGGTGLVGIWKAFAELAELGWLESAHRPRMVAVQAAGCAPVVKAFEEGAEKCEFWQGAQTTASGLRVPRSFADRLILQALRESGGTAVAVTDDEISAAQRQLGATEGLFVAPEGAATYAALEKLVQAGSVQPNERVVLLNTGMGLKYL